MKINTVAVSVLLLFLMGCKSSSDKILFSSGRAGNSDIYLMDAKGSITKQITKETSEEWSPVWINKNEISYLSQQGEQVILYKHNIDTDERSKIEHPENCVLDDKNIIYSKTSNQQIYPCKGDIYLMDGKTKAVENLTSEISGAANYIAWGRHKDEITFTSNHEGNNEVYLLNLKSKQLENITNNAANDERGDLSPDGKLLVFSTDRFEKGNQDIAIHNLETGEVKRVTESSGTELIARWSNDQKSIYFGSNMDGNWELYAYDLKTKTIKRLTNNESFDGDPRVR